MDEKDQAREPVVKDTYDELIQILSTINVINDLLDECYHIINEDFKEFVPQPRVEDVVETNLRFGMHKLATAINQELFTIEEKVRRIIYSLVAERPKTNKQEID